MDKNKLEICTANWERGLNPVMMECMDCINQLHCPICYRARVNKKRQKENMKKGSILV